MEQLSEVTRSQSVCSGGDAPGPHRDNHLPQSKLLFN